jgi:signal transduction histidine kinase/CheY-like chemotaxis protein/HPt (histidine-containing phosphotransfer) domain-containing protein
MFTLRNLSIRTRLVLVTVGSVSIALCLCSIGFVASDVQTLRAAKVRELQALEDVLGFNSSAVQAFRDPAAAKRVLSALSLQPTVTCGCLYDGAGKVLARYSPTGLEPPPLAKAMQGLRGYNAAGDLELFHPVLEDGRLLGALYISSSMADIRAHLQRYLVVCLVVMVCSLTASVLFAVNLQQSISAPILRLAEVAGKVSADKDYAVRVKYDAGDEIGKLCQTFDQMLAQVQSSEAALRAAHDELAERLHERAAQMHCEQSTGVGTLSGAFDHLLDQLQASQVELRQAHDELEDRVKQRTAQLQEEIARREQVQMDLERAKDAAEAANRAKSQFLANMSHEIRTPLNAILGFTDLLRRGADGGNAAERLEYLDTIDTSGKHLLGLINDILDLSRIEANRLEIDRVRCSPNELLVETISVLRVRAAEKGLYLNLRWEGRMPATIETDAFRLRQLLVNLLGNAIKFTREGGVSVTARLLANPARPQLEIAVADTGVGIASDKLEDIFNPFVQADNSVTREFGGTGLGLAICRRVMQALGGTIRVESELGKGSTFTVTLDTGPLGDVPLLDPVVSDAVAADRPSLQPAVVALPPARVLLAEDGSINRKLIGLILSRAGLAVTTAENGQHAVELTEAQAFDVILMDMQMPIMDGYTAAAVLRHRGLAVPIIALTAHAMKGDEEKCRRAGCSGYLAKPVNPDRLLRAVADALGERSRHASSPAPEAEPILSALPNDDVDFQAIIEEYAAALGEQIEDMQRTWAARDHRELARQAHRVKGSAGTAGFHQFTEPAQELERLAKAEQWDEARRVLDQIAAMSHRVRLPWREPADTVK